MTDLTRILKLDADQIHDLLMNHDLFTPEEVKLSARRKVELDKKSAFFGSKPILTITPEMLDQWNL